MPGPLRPRFGGYGGKYETEEEKYARELDAGIKTNTNPVTMIKMTFGLLPVLVVQQLLLV